MPDVKIEIVSATAAAEAAMRRFEGFAEGMFRRLAGLVGVAALTRFGQGLINTADNLNKMRQRVGESVETLSSFRYVAALANVETSALEMSLKIAAQRLVDASKGSQEATSAFESLNLKVKNSDGSLKTLNQLLLEVAERFEKMPDGVRKTDAAVALFGRSGQELIPLLNQGSSGIARLQEEARKLGIEISGKTAQAAEDFNDNLTRLKFTLEGLGNRVLAQVLPNLVKFTDELARAGQNAEKAEQQTNGLVIVLKSLATVAVTLYHLFLLLGNTWATFINTTVEGALGVVRVLNTLTSAVLEAGKAMFFLQTGKFGPAGESAERSAAFLALLKPAVESAVAGVQKAWKHGSDDIEVDAANFLNRLNAIWSRPDAIPKPAPPKKGGALPGGLTREEYSALWEEALEIDQYYLELSQEKRRVAERKMEIALLEKQAEIREIQGRDDLTQAEKKTLLLEKLREEGQLIAKLSEVYKLLSMDSKESTEVQLQAIQRLQQLQEDLSKLNTESRRLYEDGFFGTMRRGVRELADEWGNFGANIAGTVMDSVRGAVEGVGDAIMGAIEGTKTWGQVFQQVGRNIIAQLIQVTIEWIARMTIVRALQAAFNTQQKTEAATRAATEAPGAALAATSSYGAAAIIGAAALAAVLALALSAAFATGGLVGGRGSDSSDNIVARLSPGEYVVRAAAVRANGLDFMNRINNPNLAQPAYGRPAAPAASGGGPPQVHVVYVHDEQELRRFLESRAGEQIVINHVSNNKNRLGIQS
jgi:hypothetical protein